MNKEGSLLYTAQEVQALLGISRTKAYRIIRELNEELANKGYIVISGKIPKAFFKTKIYGEIKTE